MNSKYMYICGAIVGTYLFSKLFLTSKKRTPLDDDPTIICLIDQKLDHIASAKDFFSPKIDAFDKPFEICKRIDAIPKDKHIKLLLCTKGGTLASCEKILKKLRNHPGGYTAYIKNECFSAGTVLALGAKEIVMKDDSYLGKIDPQITTAIGEGFPAIVYHDLPRTCVTDYTIAKIRLSTQALNYTEHILNLIFGEEQNYIKEEVKKHMIYSEFPHSKTFDMQACLNMKLQVREPHQEELFLFGNY